MIRLLCRFFGGMIKDVKNCYNPKMYGSMIRDGINMQCLASIIFLFFACISPIVTFGGLMGQQTDGHMVRLFTASSLTYSLINSFIKLSRIRA